MNLFPNATISRKIIKDKITIKDRDKAVTELVNSVDKFLTASKSLFKIYGSTYKELKKIILKMCKISMYY